MAQLQKDNEHNIPPGFIKRNMLRGHLEPILGIAWSLDGQILASGSIDGMIQLWNPLTGQALRTLEGHTDSVESVAWSPDGHFLVSGSDDKTIRLWDPLTGRHIATLEGHTDFVRQLSFSSDGYLLASRSNDDTIRFWRTSSWETLATLEEPSTTDAKWPSALAFHPTYPMLATVGEEDRVIHLWNLKLKMILGADENLFSAQCQREAVPAHFLPQMWSPARTPHHHPTHSAWRIIPILRTGWRENQLATGCRASPTER
jgi:WD40 repeat protein